MIERLQLEDATLLNYNKQPCLQNVNFDFPLGEAVQIQGEPHSGKSLLLQTLACVQKVNKGRYLINCSAVNALRFSQLGDFRKHMGLMFEHGGVIANKTLRGNIEFAIEYHKVQNQTERLQQADALIEYFGLGGVQHFRPAELSVSHRRLAGLVRALVGEPQILFLDRPELGMSESQVSLMLAYLKQTRAAGGLPSMFLCTEHAALIDELVTVKLGIEQKQIVNRHA